MSKNRNVFLSPLKSKGFKEESVTKIGLYDLLKSTTLESNKSHRRSQASQDVLKALSFAETGMTPKQIAELLHVHEGTMRTHLLRMADRGEVRNLGDGRYALPRAVRGV